MSTPKKLPSLNRAKLSRRNITLFIALFVVVGAIKVAYIHAASPTLNIEPESAALSGNAHSGTDSTASGGKYVQFGSNATPPPVGANPCGRTASAPATYQHVIWIWDENHSLDTIMGNSQAPFINKLASECGVANNYSDLSHPSAPNYVGATSGAINAGKNDCAPSACPDGDVSIFQQATSWKSYSEGEPTNCDPGFDGNAYDVNHNPPVYYTQIKAACAKDAVPLGTPTSGALATDLANNTLPEFSFIDPNTNDDMHDGTIAQGDAYISQIMTAITSSSAYQSGNTAVFFTFDEGETTELVSFIAISPSTKPGTVTNAAFNHYSLLRTTEEMLGINNLLQNANSAPSMRSAFNI